MGVDVWLAENENLTGDILFSVRHINYLKILYFFEKYRINFTLLTNFEPDNLPLLNIIGDNNLKINDIDDDSVIVFSLDQENYKRLIKVISY